MDIAEVSAPVEERLEEEGKQETDSNEDQNAAEGRSNFGFFVDRFVL